MLCAAATRVFPATAVRFLRCLVQKSILLLLLVLQFPLQAMEDTLPRGASYLNLRLRMLTADDYFDHEEIRVPARLDGRTADYEDLFTELTYAYGWTPEMTFLAKTIYRRRELNAGESLSQSGISGVYLALRQRLSRLGNASRMSAETGVWLPEADRDDPLPLDSGDISWVFGIGYAQDFFPTAGGFEMDFGYRLRNGDPDDELYFDTNLKTDLRGFATLTVAYHVVESKKDKQVIYAQTVYPNEAGFQGAEIEVTKVLSSRWQTTLGYEHIIKGRNGFRTTGWRLGFRRFF